MNDLLLVHMQESKGKLDKDSPNGVLAQLLALPSCEVLFQVSILAELHNYVHLGPTTEERIDISHYIL